MLDCLSNLVGLTDKECSCFSGSEPTEFDALNASTTGYFLTDEDYGLPLLDAIFSANDCGDGETIFDVLLKARANGLNAIYTDLQAALLKFYDKTIQPFTGLVGQRRASGYKTVNTSVAGHLIEPMPIKDAAYIVSHIFVGVNTTGNLAITISSNDPDFTDVTQTVNITQAGVFQRFALTAPVSLPFYSKNVEGTNCGLRYTVSYPVSGGLKPSNNAFSCCGGRNTEWKKYMTVSGFETNDLNDLLENCASGKNSNAQGLVLEGYLTCDNLQWLCELEELNGYDFRDVLARTLQHKATGFLTQHILDSTNINFWTTLNREALYGKRNHALKRYDELILWLASNLPNYATGCYQCKPGKIQRRSF